MLVIAAREYGAAVRSKTFLISLLMMPLLMGGSILIQYLVKDVADITEKRLALVDRTPGQKLTPFLLELVAKYNQEEVLDPNTGQQVKARFAVEQVPPSGRSEEAVAQQRFALSERVRQGELTGFLEVLDHSEVPSAGSPPAAPSIGPVLLRYQSNRPSRDSFARYIEGALTAEMRTRLADEAKLPMPLRLALVQPVKLETKGLSLRDAETGAIADAPEQSKLAPMVVPAMMMLLMFVVVLMAAAPLMQGVVEEKMQRIAEVLLGSVRPFELMMGKLSGMAGVSLTMVLVYLAGAFWAAHHYGFAEYISLDLLFWFLIYQALAALMYGSLFIAVGAACADMKETQNLMWPVMVLATSPLFVLGNVLQEPNSPVALGLSFFPFATPMLMVSRLAVPPGLPVWQPVVGVVLVLATTIGCVYAAGRIFRVGILLQGKGARLSDLVKWVFRG
jgi:ABC-2 type transport system permease protein